MGKFNIDIDEQLESLNDQLNDIIDIELNQKYLKKDGLFA